MTSILLNEVEINQKILDHYRREDGKSQLLSRSTMTKYLSTVRKINKLMGWPTNFIHIDLINNNLTTLIERFVASISSDKPELRAHNQLCGAVKIFRCYADATLFGRAVSKLKGGTGELFDHWTGLKSRLETLAKELDDDPGSARGLIALVFSFGYVLRVGEIFKTRYSDDGINNYLDLFTCKWTVRQHKTQGPTLVDENGVIDNSERIVRVFAVDPYLCELLFYYYLKQPIGTRSPWMLHKKNKDEPYASGSMDCCNWPADLGTNDQCRESFETWNRNHAGHTADEVEQWHYILGHGATEVDKYYDMGPDAVPTRSNASDPVVEELEVADCSLDTSSEPELTVRKPKVVKVIPRRLVRPNWNSYSL
jgi:hypothetical protein